MSVPVAYHRVTCGPELLGRWAKDSSGKFAYIWLPLFQIPVDAETGVCDQVDPGKRGKS